MFEVPIMGQLSVEFGHDTGAVILGPYFVEINPALTAWLIDHNIAVAKTTPILETRYLNLNDGRRVIDRKDTVGLVFSFEKPEDALLFKLRWA